MLGISWKERKTNKVVKLRNRKKIVPARPHAQLSEIKEIGMVWGMICRGKRPCVR